MKILIARDEAFNFIYRANVDSLATMGNVDFFSPLHDARPAPCDLMYLPGGYPELYLEDIARNPDMMKFIREYAENGGRIYAECGGFMYLCNDIDETPMCGVLPFRATMQGARLHLGYRQMDFTSERDGRQLVVKGHEFHYSSVIDAPHPSVNAVRNQRSAKGLKVDTAIYEYKNVIAGYTHWYWAEHGFPFF